jgi:hypothetical protein
VRKDSRIQNFWQVNDFFISADQILIAWAEQTYNGIPLAVLPTAWLSIILRFFGRTDDDYKSYCTFMRLPRHRNEADEAVIDPIWVMTALSKKTTDVELKEKIVTELINNKTDYVFDNEHNSEQSVEKVFDKIVFEMNAEKDRVVAKAKKEMHTDFQEIKATLEQQLSERSSEQEYTLKYAQNKANRKTDKYKRLAWLKVVLPLFGCTMAVLVIVLVYLKSPPIYPFITNVDLFSASIIMLISTGIPTAFVSVLKYLSSDERRDNLVEKYKKEANKNMEYEK